MLADLHCHTRRCGHASGDVSDYVESAARSGLAVIGMADHLPFVDRVDRTLTMGRDELPDYVNEVRAAAAEAPLGLEVLLGIEADYIPGTEEGVAALLDRQPFDYVLGSVHVLGDWPFDHPDHRHRYEGLDPDDFWHEYLAAVRAAAATGLFDVLAHPDLAKKFDVRPSGDMREAYAEVAETVARAGMAVEVNTSGLFKPVEEIYPEPAFLEVCRARGVPIVLGSDAHRAEHVGRAFDRAIALARSVGYREALVFRGRVAEAYPLPEHLEVAAADA